MAKVMVLKSLVRKWLRAQMRSIVIILWRYSNLILHNRYGIAFTVNVWQKTSSDHAQAVQPLIWSKLASNQTSLVVRFKLKYYIGNISNVYFKIFQCILWRYSKGHVGRVLINLHRNWTNRAFYFKTILLEFGSKMGSVCF